MSKKKKAGIVVLVILLILAAAAGTIYFLGHRYYSKTNFLSDEEAVEQIEKQKAERKAAQEKTATEEISKQVCISQAGLKRIFKKYSGFGIHKYFLKLKLKLAAEMLVSGVSVTDTAEKLSFSSQGYFTKAFHREIGVLPSSLCKKL